MFGIFPEKKPVNIEGECVLPASIVIDNFSEMMDIPLSYWNISDYQDSWRCSLKEGLENQKHATLAVSMYEPESANFIFTWVLYFFGDDVFVQNSVLFLDECPGFTPETINNFTRLRTTHNEDGIKISEWKTDLNSVLAFYNALGN
ncbi:hypothetical protein [Dryocola sp. BD613]|uniref:hypothetical protein n=1 Tax=Dryocola sp. BD613 TaxID=3133272 RepID=UPI003F5032FC